MLDTIFIIGKTLSILVLLVAVYLVLVEASGAAPSPDEDNRLHREGPDY
jgi:hypothetical protein